MRPPSRAFTSRPGDQRWRRPTAPLRISGSPLRHRPAYRGLVSDAFLDAMSLPRRVEAWQEILAAGRSTTLVAEASGALAGFADYGPARDEDLDPSQDAELNALYVQPQYWSHGFDYALWAEALSLLQPTHFVNCVLWVLEGNRRARAFCERQRCMLDPSARKLWRPKTEALVEVRYSIRVASDMMPRVPCSTAVEET